MVAAAVALAERSVAPCATVHSRVAVMPSASVRRVQRVSVRPPQARSCTQVPPVAVVVVTAAGLLSRSTGRCDG